MYEHSVSYKGYCLAASLGALGGALAVALASGDLPRAAAKMKERMEEACKEHCGCLPEDAGEGGDASSVGPN
ncbi:MAG: hypothetical protein KDD47_11605 [Acidobacteria bacterium]|nr:hypothetical protein [Acidobacteriota bacterium]